MPHQTLIDEFGYVVSHDLLKLFLGEKIGSGQFRDVYLLNIDESKVVKVEKGVSYENFGEYDVWQNVQHTKWGRWFAPVLWFSNYGSCLIQPRCAPLPATGRPKRLPDFFADIKSDNWGLLNGRVVCFDYGHHQFYRRGVKRAKLVKAHFHA